MDEDALFQEFHERRRTQYIMSQFFIKEKHLLISPRKFQQLYVQWKRKNDIQNCIIPVEHYLEFLCREFHKDSEKVSELSKQQNTKSGSPVVIAVALFSQAFPEIPENELLDISGVSLKSLKNHGNRIRETRFTPSER
jgi:hypothetical protein